MIPQLSSLEPEHVPSWADLNNIDRLCARCHVIDWEPVKMYMIVADEYTFFPKIPLYRPYPTLGQLRKTAHEGCHLCTLLSTCLFTARNLYLYSPSSTPGRPGIDNEAIIKVDVEVVAHRWPVRFTVDIDRPGIELREWWVSHSIPIKGDIVQSSHSIQFSSLAEDIARFWLEDCFAKHERCMSEAPMLPKRVIDVESGHEPFLCIPEGKRDRYAALSYCFGNGPVLTTTGQTLTERQAGIKMSILPKTVRDAVTWTRQLGLKYLWVDSLCILQDSLTDWEVELSTMADIYRDATVTIAATAASHAGDGCAPMRNKLQLASCTPVPGIVVEANFLREEWIFTKGPLEKRGWTYQEIQLSRRVLRCGGEELAWQCRTCKRLERDPVGSMGHITDHATRTYHGTRTLDDEEMMNGPSSFRGWYQMVAHFMSRDLTYSDDILPAFSGMARHFAELLRRNKTRTKSKSSSSIVLKLYPDSEIHPYICGLWEDDLLHGLLWWSVEPGSPILYRGPSWSWVAYKSPTLTYSQQALQKNDFCAEVLDVSVTVPGLNPYGRVSSGKMTMLGPVAPMHSSAYGDDSGVLLRKPGDDPLRWDLVGAPKLGCIYFRLQDTSCLILAPETRCYPGTYRRVGFVLAADNSRSLGMELLKSLDWRNEVVTII